MKKIFTYILLFLFIFQSTSSFWIMASFYVNQKYIAENICINRFDLIPLCNGTCFLTKELKENDKKEQKIPTIKEKELQLYCQQIHFFSCDPGFIVLLPKNNLGYRNFKVTSPLLYSVFHPPETA